MYDLPGIRSYITQYRPAGVIVDTNILLVLLIGMYKPSFISQCRLTQQYTSDDFDLIKQVLSFFPKVVVTPHILTEVSNLSLSRKSKMKLDNPSLYLYCNRIIEFLKSAEERYLPVNSLFAIEVTKIADFGFSDMGMLELAKQAKMPIFTDDTPFHAYTMSQRVPIIKFEHIKYAGVLP